MTTGRINQVAIAEFYPVKRKPVALRATATSTAPIQLPNTTDCSNLSRALAPSTTAALCGTSNLLASLGTACRRWQHPVSFAATAVIQCMRAAVGEGTSRLD